MAMSDIPLELAHLITSWYVKMAKWTPGLLIPSSCDSTVLCSDVVLVEIGVDGLLAPWTLFELSSSLTLRQPVPGQTGNLNHLRTEPNEQEGEDDS